MTVDPFDFRKVVGHFATGVTVVTAAVDGGHHGMTASSFTSVSLDPVLVLVSIERVSRFHDFVLAAGGYAVNVLAADQEYVSRWFAARGADHDPLKAPDLPCRVSPLTGAAVLEASIATIDCRTWAVYDGGDHSLFVGEVVGLDLHRPGAAPLLYFEGRYHTLAD